MKIVWNDPRPVLVTGGTGYIASWIVKYLLEAGANVRITVRDKKNTIGYDHLSRIASDAPGKLEVFEADLLHEGSFDQAVAGCGIVFHTASPFRINKLGNPTKSLIMPALNGTINVINAVNSAHTVDRLVLTSSVAAIYGDAIEASLAPQGQLTEEQWNTSSSPSYQPYSYSKTAAERKAWELADSQSRWKLLTINPGLVLGPSLSTRTDSTSIDIMISIANGKYRMGIPDFRFAIVDVRDVARAHILAATTPAASGRHITAAHQLSMPDIARILKTEYGNALPLPKGILPKAVLYIAGPFMGFSWKYLRLNLGHTLRFSNERSIKNLGMHYRDIRDTLVDHIEQLKQDGLIRMHS